MPPASTNSCGADLRSADRGRPRALAWVLVATFLALACGDAGSDRSVAPEPVEPGPAEAGVPDEWTFATLEERTVRAQEEDVAVELVRGMRPDGVATYLLYVHVSTTAPSPAPVVVMNEPYTGIDWTGEDVDARWASRGPGLQADVDAPKYDGDDVISYEGATVDKLVEGDVAWRLNGFAVVHTFGRFYAGGDVGGDVLDAAAAYFFIRSRASAFDLGRIGSFGGSWGGMMALFGARAAPPEASPKAVAALTPLSDFVDQVQWTDVDLPKVYPDPRKVEAFFSPYWRRAEPSMGRPPVPGEQSRPYTHEGLCPGLPGRVFVAHDDWDMLIPIRQSESLVARCGSSVEPVYWRRGPVDHATVPLDHGPVGAEGPTIYTFAWTFVASALARPDATTIVTAGDEASLTGFLGLVRDAQRAGRDSGRVAPRLREIADARVSLFDTGTQSFRPGAEVVAKSVNAVWQTTYDAASVEAALASGLPPPP